MANWNKTENYEKCSKIEKKWENKEKKEGMGVEGEVIVYQGGTSR